MKLMGRTKHFAIADFFFLMWAIFNIFIKFVTTLLLVSFGFLAMRNAGSLTRDRTRTPCTERGSQPLD